MGNCVSESFTEAQAVAIRGQMDRILSSAPFRNSKRYSAFLRYIVEQTLSGRANQLKERCLAVEVFARGPDYDSSVDHIVRSAASEVRRRLAQYYLDAADAPVRIELRPGSYVPRFELAPEPPVRQRRWSPKVAAVSAGILACLIVVAAGLSHESPADSLDILARQSDKVLLGVSDRQGSVSARDAFTVARLTAALAQKKKRVELRPQSELTPDDLARGPVVLIGGSQDKWPLRLLEGLRYRFEKDAIVDRYSAHAVGWARQPLSPEEDFALVTRVKDKKTGLLIVIAAGLTDYGTQAAAEFITNAEYRRGLLAESREDWENGNVQVVLAIRIADGTAGPPRVVARHFW